jgi:hypothetical protein
MPRVPTVPPSSVMGTQMKLTSSCRSAAFAARCRKRGSRLTRGTTDGTPDCATLPVTPSPSR